MNEARVLLHWGSRRRPTHVLCDDQTAYDLNFGKHKLGTPALAEAFDGLPIYVGDCPCTNTDSEPVAGP